MLDGPLCFWDKKFKMAAFQPNDKFEHVHSTITHFIINKLQENTQIKTQDYDVSPTFLSDFVFEIPGSSRSFRWV